MGALMFKDRGQLVELGGVVVVDPLKLSAWPLPTPRETSNGEAYDWTGQADPAHAADLEVPNRHIVLNGRKLRIVGNALHTFIPHVQLQLREIRQGG